MYDPPRGVIEETLDLANHRVPLLPLHFIAAHFFLLLSDRPHGRFYFAVGLFFKIQR